jgi:DNA-binding MurR/RpiR family transcriptional regulator
MAEASVSFLMPDGWPTFKRRGFAFRIIKLYLGDKMTTATSLNELQQQIRDRYDNLSKRLQQVSRYVLDNTNSVAFDTVAVIAERADVPPSTLIRFANAFDFTGFNEMKQLFRMNLVEETASYSDRARMFREMERSRPETPLDILQEFARSNAQALQQLAARAEPEMLERAVQLLAEADTIYIAGLRRSFSVAAYLTYALSHLECRPVLLDGMGGMLREQINRIKARDIVVSISFSPYAEETVMVSETAASVGARHDHRQPDKPAGDLQRSLLCGERGAVDAFRSQSATLCLVQSLVVALAYQLGGGK